MPGLNVVFSVADRFSQAMNKFERGIDKLAGKSKHLDDELQDTKESTNDVKSAADKASMSFGGFGASMLVVNQALQAFQRLSEPIKGALDDIGDKERALIILGKEAGEEFNEFAKNAAQTFGRVESEIRKAGLKWRNLGLGGEDIMQLTALADRFANLNPGRSFEDIAETLKDAAKSKDVGGLAELLGGGEGVERKLRRSGVERDLKRGNVTGAMNKFAGVADTFGYTQKKADEMGMTIDRKIEKITNLGKNKFTEMFSDIVSRAEPYIDKILGWLQSEDAQQFFNNVSAMISNTIDVIAMLADKISEVFTWVTTTTTGFFGDIVGESVSFLDMIVGLFVGGVTQLGGSIWNIVATIWNFILDITQNGVNSVIDVGIGFRNTVVSIFHKLKTTVTSIFAGLISGILKLADKLGNTKIGEKLGLDDAAKTLREVHETLEDISNSAPDLVDSTKHHVNFQSAKLDKIDSVGRAAENIEGAIGAVHKFFNLDGAANANKNNEKKKYDALKNISRNTDKIRSSMSHEQDLRWMKEMAEQRFVNEVNLRQLTPTVNVKVSGSKYSPEDIGRAINDELMQMADAGTFNAYGEVG